MHRLLARLALAGCAIGAAGCATPPPAPALPQLVLPAAFKEGAPWVTAEPEATPDEAWWTVFGDAELDALQQRLLASSPDLAAALARHRQAEATLVQVRAAESPSLGAGASVQRLRQSERRPLRVLGPLSPDVYGSDTVSLDLGWELDLWGRVQHQVAAGRAQEQAAVADLGAARVALQAQLADTWLVLRGLDQDAALLAQAEAAYAQAERLAQQRHAGGAASGLDLARAQVQLAAVRSQIQQSRGQRAVLEHAIAALVGEPASSFTLAERVQPIALPAVPVGLPSTLLRRRADVAAARQRVAAAAAGLGVGRAALFPAVTISAQLGFQSSDLGRFIAAPNLFWAIGPALAASLFDGGRRRAEVTRLEAALDEAGARWRGVVLASFQQVEDSLVLLQRAGEAAAHEAQALAAARRALAIAQARYNEGAASGLEVVLAQAAELQAQRSAAELAVRQRRACVQLVRALGGGWREDGA